MKFLSSIFITNRFFIGLAIVAALFALGFKFPFLLLVAWLMLFALISILLLELIYLYRIRTPIVAERILPKVLSLSDQNTVRINIQNQSKQRWSVELIDELPVELQERHYSFPTIIPPNTDKINSQVTYEIRPVVRGEYGYGYLYGYLAGNFKLVQRRVILDQPTTIKVYPSILQMKQYELIAMSEIAIQNGLKKIRRIGHSYEFEQIKTYQKGDDFRSINWKASSRRNELMVNKYEDERSQRIYCLIDKSRNMQMPFHGLTLMDYAINSTLALSNIILKKHDKVGLLSFSNKLGNFIPCSPNPRQLKKILEALYKEKPYDVESNFELLHFAARKLIHGRSLLILMTNFESPFALKRQLPALRKINRNHLLLVVFFRNTGIEDFVDEKPTTLRDLYQQATAEKYVHDKNQFGHLLRQYGIQSLYTRPEDLSINVINKYLELKSRGLL